ncbi:MAG: hypothetical protein ACK4UO_10930 [Pseudolabrys sp.]
MTLGDRAALASEISTWFSNNIEVKKLPSSMMCEAFIMLPLCEWLGRNGFELQAEYWSKPATPYHAFDLRAQRNDDVYLFDLKFFRGSRRFSGSVIKNDLRHLARTDYIATHRYCLVCGERSCFPNNVPEGLTKQIKDLLDSDGLKNVVTVDDDVVVKHDRSYTTVLWRVTPVPCSRSP